VDDFVILVYEEAEIERVEIIKLLGVKLDNRLSYKEHIETMIINKLRKYIPVFYQLRNVLSTQNLLKIYFSNVNSIFSYCILVYHTGNLTNIQKVCKLQKRILKVIFNVRTQNLDTYMKRYKILNISQLFSMKLLTLGHTMKYRNRILPHFLQNTYQSKTNLNLRNKNDFIVNFHRTSISQRSIDYIVGAEWNMIPPWLKCIPSLKKFKKHAKQWILSGKLITQARSCQS